MDLVAVITARYLFIGPIIVLGWHFLRQPWDERRKMALLAFPSLALAYGIGVIANHLYIDPRPFVVGRFTPLVAHTRDNGFPSDHTLLLSTLAALASCWNGRLGLLLWLVALLVGAARVYVGLHHTVDILGSILIAVGAVALIFAAIREVRARP